MAVVYQDSGFVFTLKKSDCDGELPKGFINVSMKKGKWYFSSMDLVSTSASSPPLMPDATSVLQKKMNARMKDALDETLMLSDK
jgi:DNA mismatch repair protein MSH4